MLLIFPTSLQDVNNSMFLRKALCYKRLHEQTTDTCCCCCILTGGNGPNGHNSIAELVALYLPVAWAARYNTCLLMNLTPKGVVFSFLLFSFSYLPVANVPANTQHEFLNNSVKDMCQREERQEAVVRAHPDVTQVHKPLQRGHGCHQGVVSQHHTLRVACKAKKQTQACDQGVVSQHHTLRVACKANLQPRAVHAGMLHVSVGQTLATSP